MGGLQAQPAPVPHQPLEGEASLKPGHHHLARPGLQAPIHDQQVAVADAGPLHRLATHPQ